MVAGIFPRVQPKVKKIIKKTQVCSIKCDGLDSGVIFLDNFGIGTKRCIVFHFLGEAYRKKCPPYLGSPLICPWQLSWAENHRARCGQTYLEWPWWMSSIPWLYAQLPHCIFTPHVSITLRVAAVRALHELFAAITKTWTASPDAFPTPSFSWHYCSQGYSKTSLQGLFFERCEIVLYR